MRVSQFVTPSRAIGWSLLLLGLTAAVARAEVKVEAKFFGVDFSDAKTYSWKPGVPAPNFEIERAIRQAVEKQLAAKGLQKVDGEADCYVVTTAVRERYFPVGLLRVSVLEGSTASLAWQGMATGVLTTEKLKKRQKRVARVVKKMFQQFPALSGG